VKVILGYVLVALLAGLVPFGLIALARSQPSAQPPVHPIQDMYKQSKFRPQHGNPMFADDRAMRPLLPGVAARDDLRFNGEMVYDPNDPRMMQDQLSGGSSAAEQQYSIDFRERPAAGGNDAEKEEAQYTALTEGIETKDGKPAYVKAFPVKVTMDLLERGRERYTINCAICHGQAGYGDGTVALRAAAIKEIQGDAAGWNAPKNFHSDDMRQQPVGQIYNTITNGARTMPAYAKQISVLDRWAIVAYVKALQRSQDAKAEDLPEDERERFK
jgi:mono/diheme cytochrome c family protein